MSIRTLKLYTSNLEKETKKCLTACDVYTLHKSRRVRFPSSALYYKDTVNC